MTKIIADLHKIVAAATTWMSDRPFDTYTFLLSLSHAVPAGGGMEHAFSTAIEINANPSAESLIP